MSAKATDKAGPVDDPKVRSQIASPEEAPAAQQREAGEYSRQLAEAREEIQSQQRRLRYGEERLSSILEAILDAVFCLDGNGVVMEWNPQAEMILGWSREQALGKTVDGLQVSLPRSGVGSGSGPTETAWTDGLLLDQRTETTARHRDGWDFPAEVGIARVGRGADALFTVFLRDITVRKENEEDLEDARDGALTASRMKSEFLAVMSHEIRTAMNGVVGMSELLLTTQLTAEQRNYGEAIHSSAEGLLSVLSDILDFSRIEIGQLILEAIPFDLRQVVEETADLLAPQATQKNLDLSVRYADGAPTGFVGDSGRLRQVLTSLIGNAVKFTQAGRVSVAVECDRVAETHARMSIVIEDTGIGIPADKLAHIFEKFARADSSTTRKHQGIGLGLAISKRLLGMMGASIQVESQPGKGSRFLICMELPRDTRARAPSPASDLSGLRVLVVDAHDYNRGFVHDQLSANGAVARAAAGGQEALAAMRAGREAGQPFDVALIDYHFPDTEGEVLALEIKSDPALAATVLVALTSVAGQRYASRMLLMGFAAVVVKPVRSSQLFRAMARARGYLPSGQPNREIRGAGAASPQAPATAAEGVHRRARVLVAEDSMVNQKVVSRMLEKLDCAVDLAADGKQAAQMAESVRYDLIFMDCHMPEMDGYEASSLIRSRQKAARTPIIALTASAMEDSREHCLQAGMDDYLSKPINVSDLADALRRWAPASGDRPR